MGVLPAQVFEGVQVAGRREPGLSAGDVESGDLLIAVSDREVGDLPGTGGVPHRCQQRADADSEARRPCGHRARRETIQNGLNHLVEVQALFDVQLRGEPHLGIDHPVRGQILHALGRDPDQCVTGLHHAHRVRERLQVALQRARVGGLGEPAGELDRVLTR